MAAVAIVIDHNVLSRFEQNNNRVLVHNIVNPVFLMVLSVAAERCVTGSSTTGCLHGTTDGATYGVRCVKVLPTSVLASNYWRVDTDLCKLCIQSYHC